MKTRLKHCSTALLSLLLMSGLIACMDGRRSRRPQTGDAGSEKSASATSGHSAREEAVVPGRESGWSSCARGTKAGLQCSSSWRPIGSYNGEFAVTRFSPVTGSCVGLDLVHVLAVSGEGALQEGWSGSTFDAQGSKSQIASVEFTDRDGDGNLEILRRGRLVDCGDDCLCRDGPVLERFEAVYGWDEASGRFVERPLAGSELSPTSR